jgi:transformer-2 protein
MSNRRRHIGNREEPTVSPCLGVFGLSLYTTERELEKEFSKFGPLEKVTVVLDGKVIMDLDQEHG